MKAPLFTSSTLVLCGSLIAACQPALPEKHQMSENPRPPSAREISAQHERYFAEQLPLLQARNPEAEAQAAIANGERYFLCNAGRSSTVPGIEPAVYAQVRDRCETRCLDGVTDALYGANHRAYLSAALAYSARWNQVMLAACR